MRFYAHNAGNFDVYLIIKNIIDLPEVKNLDYLMDDGNSIFYMKFDYNDYTFEFKDSYKLMPLGLDKLIKDFKMTVGHSHG